MRQRTLCDNAARRTATEASKPMNSMMPATRSVHWPPSTNPEVIASAIFGASSPNRAAGPSPLRNTPITPPAEPLTAWARPSPTLAGSPRDSSRAGNVPLTAMANDAPEMAEPTAVPSCRTVDWVADDKSASATARAEYEIFKDIPPAARVDRTWDNGTEASLHMLVDEALGMLTYFADPYGSWQRGSNENRNDRIRRYLPKGTGFGDLAQEDLDAIVGEINDTPMKLLGYKTPNEVWDEEIAKLQSKAASPNTSVALTN